MPEKRKIVWLAHEANLSGANIALLEYIDVLSGDYVFHVIIPHDGTMKSLLHKKGVAVSVICQYNWAGVIDWWNLVQWMRLIIRSVLAVTATKKLIKKEKAALICTNTLGPFIAAITAQQLGKPHIWWIHEFGEEDFGFKIGWEHQQWAFQKMAKWSKMIICNSEAVRKKFQALMPTANVRRIYQPVSWPEKPVVLPGKKTKFLMFGQIIASKGHAEVLSALVEVKKRQPGFAGALHIKGPCENRGYLEELLRFIGLHHLQEQVKIETGFFEKEAVMPFYEVLIVASRCEAFGRVIVEANKAGLKVIVKNGGGAPELVNSTNGILYDDEKELVAIMSGEKLIPAGHPHINYSEKEEIDELKKLLGAL